MEAKDKEGEGMADKKSRMLFIMMGMVELCVCICVEAVGRVKV